MSASDTYTERDGSEFATYDDFAVEFRPASHIYWIHHNGQRLKVPSVTGILKLLDKPALLRWYEKKGAEGVAGLVVRWQRYAREELAQGRPAEPILQGLLLAMDQVAQEPEDAIELVRAMRLGADAKRDEGASRGTLIHNMQESYVITGSPPKLADFEPEHRGFVQGYCKWLLVAKPEPIACEQIVGSMKHGFAGKLDMIATCTFGADRAEAIVDLKTGRGRVYPEAWAQLCGYSIAYHECSASAVRHRLVVALGEDSEFTPSLVTAGPETFLAILRAHNVMRHLRELMRAS